MNITEEEWGNHELNPNRIEFKVTKKKPKEGAQTYRLTTIEDMFKHVKEENVESFLKELKLIFYSQFLISATSIKDQYFKHLDFTNY